MAITDEFTNHTEEVDGQVRVFCANCGDPEGGEVEVAVNLDGDTRAEQRPPTGYALEGQLAGLGWKKVGDQLVCGDPRCGAALAGVDPDPVLAATAQDEQLTPEQVAAMSPIVTGDDFDSDAIDDFESFAQANQAESEEDKNEPGSEGDQP